MVINFILLDVFLESKELLIYDFDVDLYIILLYIIMLIIVFIQFHYVIVLVRLRFDYLEVYYDLKIIQEFLNKKYETKSKNI